MSNAIVHAPNYLLSKKANMDLLSYNHIKRDTASQALDGLMFFVYGAGLGATIIHPCILAFILAYMFAWRIQKEYRGKIV